MSFTTIDLAQAINYRAINQRVNQICVHLDHVWNDGSLKPVEDALSYHCEQLVRSFAMLRYARPTSINILERFQDHARLEHLFIELADCVLVKTNPGKDS